MAKVFIFCFLLFFSSFSLIFCKLDPEPSDQDVHSRNTFSTHLKYAMPSSMDTNKDKDPAPALDMDSTEGMSASGLNPVTVSEDEEMDLIPKKLIRFKPMRLTALSTPSPFILSSNPITVTPAATSTTTVAPTTVGYKWPKGSTFSQSALRIRYKKKPTKMALQEKPTKMALQEKPTKMALQEKPTKMALPSVVSSAPTPQAYGAIHSSPFLGTNPVLDTSSYGLATSFQSIKSDRCPSFEQLYSSSNTVSEREPLMSSSSTGSTRDIDEHQVQYYLDKARSSLSLFQEKVRRELSELREKESVLNENLVKVSKIVNSNDAALSSCQSHLETLETSVNEVYGREKDIESRAGILESENAMLRDRLRKLSGIEIKRKPVKTNSSLGGSAVSRTRSKVVIVFRNETIATFGTIIYRMREDNLIKIEDVIKSVDVPISKGFDYLKIIRAGIEYKLTLANSRGNAFFDHKKFDKYYSNIPDELRFIKVSSITTANGEVNWLEHNTKCGFWSCFFLKPGLLDSAPQVFSVRDKSLIGHLSPTIAYFDLSHMIITNGTHHEQFTHPYLDKDIEGNFFIAETYDDDWKKKETKRLLIDLNSLEIHDRSAFAQMIKTAFP